MSYHHGDLRSALLEAAVGLISERGIEGLSLRECARIAGVSHAAPYRHFEDKDALLAAIAGQGFQWLTEAATAAMADRASAKDRLDAYGVAYVRFAVENPVHFRVMFTGERKPGGDGPYPQAAFDLLMASAAEIAGEKEALATATAAWSLPHGLAMLILDRRLPPEHVATPAAAEALARQAFMCWRTVLR